MRLVPILLVAALAACSPPPPVDHARPDLAPLPTFDVQGHRGARGLAPENTLPAFRRALDLGVPTLELDLAVSADGEVVVSHEPWMDHLICSHPDGRPVSEDEAPLLNLHTMTAAEIARYDCGSRRHPRFPEQQPEPAAKPLLRDVFALAEAYTAERGLPPVFYNVETKSKPGWDNRYALPPDAFVEVIWREVETAGVAERFILQSFDVRTLQVAHGRGLPIRLALLVAPGHLGAPEDGTPESWLADGLDRLGFTPDIYSPYFEIVTETVVERAHADGMLVLPWTVNEPDEMARQKAMGVDGIITDYPDRAMPLFER